VIARYLLAAVLATFQAVAADPAPAPRALPLAVEPFKGDFDGMLERRLIIVLAPYSRTFYFNDKGRERGLTADLARDFERYLNQRYQKVLGKRPLTVALVPTSRDKLMPRLLDGIGDIIAGDFTATEERRAQVDYFLPRGVGTMTEVALNGTGAPPIAAAEDLAGGVVHVRRSSSYYQSLTALNSRLKAARKPAVRLHLVPDALEDEDLMEMLNAGLVQTIIVDDYLARMWAPVLPKIRINEGAVLRSGAQAGWAMRKGSPKLQAILAEFYEKGVRQVNPVPVRIAEYGKRVKTLQDPGGTQAYKRFEQTLALFRKYGHRYGFDPLLLAAQGFQESRLDQSARSPAGAVGIMQVLPSTGAEMRVGDIEVTEPNIHAGTKYMDRLLKRHFTDAHFDDTNRSLFAFAAYNAGPTAVARLRKEAAARGLDADKWFDNVEVVAAEKIGMETTSYVRNIYKYYVSYRLMAEAQEEQKKARGEVGRAK
jgi:membrane-bound lytic murein transglycosylase MltF